MTTLLASNWAWLVLVVVFIAMHRGGHGCGTHAARRHARHDRDTDSDTPKEKVRNEPH